MDEIKKFNIIVTVKPEKVLTEDEKREIMVNMKYRLEGYSTKPPPCMIGSEINIKLQE